MVKEIKFKNGSMIIGATKNKLQCIRPPPRQLMRIKEKYKWPES